MSIASSDAAGSPASPTAPASSGIRARLAAYGSSPRIVGVDIARGVAVLGMFGAHIGVSEAFQFADPSTWLDLVHGRSSILFALLAGVSLAIISGRTTVFSGPGLVAARVRIFTRAVIIFAIGGLLETLDTPIAIILPVYAVLFVVALPFLAWRPRNLFILAAVLSASMPVLHALLVPVFEKVLTTNGAITDLVVVGNYPAMIWIVFVLAGIGVGRLDLAALRVQLWLLATGVALAIIGYGAGAIVVAATAGLEAPDTDFQFAVDYTTLFTLEPHSGSSFEVIGSTGFALAVLALSLLAARRIRWVLFPVAAVGSMALTAYSVQVVVLWAMGAAPWEATDNGLYSAFVVVTLVLCSLWALLVGRGPLERLLTRVSRAASRAR